jgi:hypothetical protein
MLMKMPSLGETSDVLQQSLSGDMEDHTPACHLSLTASRNDNKGA